MLWAAGQRKKKTTPTAAGGRTGVSARRVRFGTHSGPARMLVFDPGQPGQGEPDIGTGIIDCVQVT